MKTFSTSGTGNQQTLSEIESDKIPIYDTLTDVEADLANLEVGQIGATKGIGSELSAPVDVVQSGNMHAVTSNAVAESLQSTNNDSYGSKNFVRIGDIGIFMWKNTTVQQIDLSQTFDSILNVQVTPESWGGTLIDFYIQKDFTPSQITIYAPNYTKNFEWLVIGHLKENWVDPTL